MPLTQTPVRPASRYSFVMAEPAPPTSNARPHPNLGEIARLQPAVVAPELAEFMRHYASLHPQDRLPAFADFNLAARPDLQRFCLVIAPEVGFTPQHAGEGRMSFRILAAGPEITRVFRFPLVNRLVDDIVRADPDNPPTIAEVGRYRSAANEAAHKGAGYAYLSYQKLKLRGVCNRVSTLVTKLASDGEFTANRDLVSAGFDRWLATDDAPPARTIRFLRGFDVEFRLRRVRFVIRRLNELYRTAGELGVDVGSAAIDDLKGALYEAIERAAPRWDPKQYGAPVAAAARRLAQAAMNGVDLDSADLTILEDALGLIPIDHTLDEIISVMGFAFLPPIARRAVAKAYVGFAFFDLITLPILQWTDMDEINEVLVDRISPDDARGLSGSVTLRGTSLMSFGAFFNRAWREHDFLWGRLNAAERCVDVIASAIGARAHALLDTDNLRGRLFLAILDSEVAHLTSDPDLVPGLRREVMARYGFE